MCIHSWVFRKRTWKDMPPTSKWLGTLGIWRSSFLVNVLPDGTGKIQKELRGGTPKSCASYFGPVLYPLLNTSGIIISLLLSFIIIPHPSSQRWVLLLAPDILVCARPQQHVQEWAVASHLFSERCRPGSFIHIFPIDFHNVISMTDAFVRSLFYIAVSNNSPNPY